MFVASLVSGVLAILGGVIGWSLLLGIQLPLLNTTPYVLLGAVGFFLGAAGLCFSFRARWIRRKPARMLNVAALGLDGLLVLGKLIGWATLAAVAVLLAVVALLSAYLEEPRRRCPRCRSLETTQTSRTEIPGTEHRRTTLPTSPAELYARYEVHYECRSCGHRWQREEEISKGY